MSRFEFHDRDEPVAPTDLQDLGAVLHNAAYNTAVDEEERARYRAAERSFGESEEGLKELMEELRRIPLSIVLSEIAVIVEDVALIRGAEVRTLSD